MDLASLLERDLETAAAEVLVPSLRQLGLAADEYANRLQAAASAQDGPGTEPKPTWPVCSPLLMQLCCLGFNMHANVMICNLPISTNHL